MVAVEIRKERGFPQPRGKEKQHNIYATPGDGQALSSWRMAPLRKQCLDEKEDAGSAKRTGAKNRDLEL